MEIRETLRAADRAQWRAWLEQHHGTRSEIWLVLAKRAGATQLTYLDAVEEALCFGWVDGLAKSISETESAQRFTPRAKRSHWTELNKARARRLVALGRMTPAGRAVLPDLDAPFHLSPEVERALRADSAAWRYYTQLPELYRRVRVGYIQEMQNRPAEFERRLAHFVARTAKGEQFGNWTDGGRLDATHGDTEAG